MKFPLDAVVEGCVDAGGGREHLAHVWLDAKAKTIVASDGWIMAAVPVEVEPGDVSGYIPVPAMAEARRRGRGAGPVGKLACRDGVCALENDEVVWKRPEAGTFPPWQDVLNTAPVRGSRNTVSFRINPNLLIRAAEGLAKFQASEVVMTVAIPDVGDPMHSAVRITTEHDSTRGLVAVAMPKKSVDLVQPENTRTRKAQP